MRAIKDTAEVVRELLEASGENEDARAAGAELGKSAHTITRAINIGLLPLAAVNYGFDKARDYFTERFAHDIAEKVADVPPEHLLEPTPSVAGPALQGLAFAHEEPDLKELYLNLLGTAMDGRVSSKAHPAFVGILGELTSEEARYLGGILWRSGSLPIVEVRISAAGESSYMVLYRHLAPFYGDKAAQQLVGAHPGFPAFVDNWIRLGLVEVMYSERLHGDAHYEWAEERPEVKAIQQEHEGEDAEILLVGGILRRTALGHQFADAVGITKPAD